MSGFVRHTREWVWPYGAWVPVWMAWLLVLAVAVPAERVGVISLAGMPVAFIAGVGWGEVSWWWRHR